MSQKAQVGKKEIVVIRRSDDYHACLKGRTGVWGCGKSIAAAVGDLVLSHSEVFKVVIELPPSPK